MSDRTQLDLVAVRQLVQPRRWRPWLGQALASHLEPELLRSIEVTRPRQSGARPFRAHDPTWVSPTGHRSVGIEVVTVDPLHHVGHRGTDANVALDHQIGELVPVDQHDVLGDRAYVLTRIRAEG